jgi:hypothetical protein
MIQRTFDPRSDGFHFRNGSFHFHVGPAAFRILCGGMSYAALDYFYCGLDIPESKAAPAEENPLQKYLYDRQMTAHKYTIPRFLKSWITTPQADADEFQQIEMWLNRRQPVVICLYASFHGHHVLAVGCDRSAKTIDLYDSNHPDTKVQIAYADGVWKHTPGGKVWAGWFIDWGYYKEDWPMQPPLSWRYCRSCHGLFTTSFGAISQCPVGGRHSYNDSFEYFLPSSEDDGEPGWFACEKCQGLYKPMDPDKPTVCAEKGPHFPRKIGSVVPKFGVSKGGFGEINWRHCVNCSTLFWHGNSSYGKCPSGGAHVPDRRSARPYVVDYRTVSAT